MQLTKIYLYHQRHRVILLDDSGDEVLHTRRYRQVYTRNLKVSRGTDNRILFEFVNQDQKPVDLTDMEFTFRMIDRQGEVLLLEKDLEIVNATRGQARLHLIETELDWVHPQEAQYSVERVETGKPYEPVYVDDDASARGVIEVLDQVMPQFIESGELTIPDHPPTADFVSSILNTDHQELHTFVVHFDGYEGTFTIEGAADTDDQWYTISSQTLTAVTGPVNFNVTGHHPYIRLSFSNITAGDATKIQYR